ncbi:LysE family translocator [Pelosinus propionicus]|uniref:Threonine/homoserine/homoserine lactone efflux protein n=1 Tax=Pelosinus propionicus DSM 13327 TaxID=1123291 RepID=A0A1I4I340_9FIRM|nr:LysE family transporter [Pelosinus propionicus]SFL48785.1 Threonine/homoserine/homoserine lactone efflux protein [Pelosinus propionicus DSM 13327]
MLDLIWLVKGLILGFSIAAPVGPIGILCIRRTLTQGMRTGLAAGLGAATADLFYGSIAAFGLTIITNVFVDNSLYFRIVGSGFLFYLGYGTFIDKPASIKEEIYQDGWIRAYLTTFFLTITNPMTILSFSAVFAGFGMIDAKDDFLSSCLLVTGVFLGSCLWWFILSGMVHLLRHRFNYQRLIWVNRMSGILIIGFAIVSFLGLL